MLKISEMAKLANTTRRTLIFYDQKNIFKPAYKNEAGYRYYDYSQLYDLMLIIGLRNLNIPLEDIEKIINNDKIEKNKLIDTKIKIENKIKELAKIKEVINNKIKETINLEKPTLYHPKIKRSTEKVFWCSEQSVNCTPKEVAELFSKFYKNLDKLAVMDTTKSGFLTNLTVDKPNDYNNASFRIIKEFIKNDEKILIPTIEKKAGDYVSVLIENNISGILRGLNELKAFCQRNHLKTEAYLWQINYDNKVIENGASKYMWLEFYIVKK